MTSDDSRVHSNSAPVAQANNIESPGRTTIVLFVLTIVVAIVALVLAVIATMTLMDMRRNMNDAVDAMLEAARAAERADQAERSAAISRLYAVQVYTELNRLGYPVKTPAEFDHELQPED